MPTRPGGPCLIKMSPIQVRIHMHMAETSQASEPHVVILNTVATLAHAGAVRKSNLGTSRLKPTIPPSAEQGSIAVWETFRFHSSSGGSASILDAHSNGMCLPSMRNKKPRVSAPESRWRLRTSNALTSGLLPACSCNIVLPHRCQQLCVCVVWFVLAPHVTFHNFDGRGGSCNEAGRLPRSVKIKGLRNLDL